MPLASLLSLIAAMEDTFVSFQQPSLPFAKLIFDVVDILEQPSS
jgi:hypothetical protein